MSLPWGTATSRYLIFSPVFLRLARPLPPCTREKGVSPARAAPEETRSGRARSRSFCSDEPRSTETHEGLREHKRGVMHLSYEATPSPKITNSKTSKSLFYQCFPVAWGSNMHWDPSDRFWQGPVEAGHRDATLECGCGDALRDSGTALAAAAAPRRGHRPCGGLCFGAFSLLSGRI